MRQNVPGSILFWWKLWQSAHFPEHGNWRKLEKTCQKIQSTAVSHANDQLLQRIWKNIFDVLNHAYQPQFMYTMHSAEDDGHNCQHVIHAYLVYIFHNTNNTLNSILRSFRKSSTKNPIIPSAPSPPYRFTLENFVARKWSKACDLSIWRQSSIRSSVGSSPSATSSSCRWKSHSRSTSLWKEENKFSKAVEGKTV